MEGSALDFQLFNICQLAPLLVNLCFHDEIELDVIDKTVRTCIYIVNRFELFVKLLNGFFNAEPNGGAISIRKTV